MSRSIKVCQRYIAPSDRNGNSRRIWVIFNIWPGRPRAVCGANRFGSASVAAIVDEAGSGRPEDAGYLPQLPDIHISVKVYGRLRRNEKHPMLPALRLGTFEAIIEGLGA